MIELDKINSSEKFSLNDLTLSVAAFVDGDVSYLHSAKDLITKINCTIIGELGINLGSSNFLANIPKRVDLFDKDYLNALLIEELKGYVENYADDNHGILLKILNRVDFMRILEDVVPCVSYSCKYTTNTPNISRFFLRFND